jgi:hypothetical protein
VYTYVVSLFMKECFAIRLLAENYYWGWGSNRQLHIKLRSGITQKSHNRSFTTEKIHYWTFNLIFTRVCNTINLFQMKYGKVVLRTHVNSTYLRLYSQAMIKAWYSANSLFEILARPNNSVMHTDILQ